MSHRYAWLPLGIVLAAASGQSVNKSRTPAFATTRAEFAEKMTSMKPETPESEMLKILGKPHDVFTKRDAGWKLGGRQAS